MARRLIAGAPPVTAIGRGRASSSTRRPGAHARRMARAARRCSACGASRDARASGAADEATAHRRPHPRLPGRRFPSVGALTRRRCASSARSAISTGSSRSACRIARPWLDHGAGASGIRSARDAGAAATRPLSLPAGRGRGCTRYRWARSMPASSSPAISASPPTARRSCAWRSGSATCTRASTR